MSKNGVLPDEAIRQLAAQGAIQTPRSFDSDQIQPASLDLRLGAKAYRLRASFLPGSGQRVEKRLTSDVLMHELDLSAGAVLETGCVYMVPLQEALKLPKDLHGAANPKSSTGRIDVFVRVVANDATAFDQIPAGYEGALYAEISPRTFSILAREGDRLCQLRLRRGSHVALKDITFSVDLSRRDGPVGYRARRHAGILDLMRIGLHDPHDFWEPLIPRNGRIVLDPGEFYILASKETVSVPLEMAAEMAPIAPELGEFRAHYAGFFDPGFGLNQGGSRAVLEVRSRDVPFILEDGQPVGRLVYEAMASPPVKPYGEGS
ncbi:MAG: 2'-deoxycytidine 5'-triphosphate deaminase, partial [Caulobacterales bacterium]